MNTTRKLSFLFAGICLLFGANCAVGPTSGLLFTSNSFAGVINPANDVPIVKTGESCQHQILGLIAFGSSGAGDAAQEGGVEKIATIDHSTVNVLSVLYAQYCTIVRGK
ncbi:MAG: TRL-like family protein [Spirochaetia bacterium]|nr:TRL-like family protein [Spirochaetia bacterium]